jgi:hypothetical protein
MARFDGIIVARRDRASKDPAQSHNLMGMIMTGRSGPGSASAITAGRWRFSSRRAPSSSPISPGASRTRAKWPNRESLMWSPSRSTRRSSRPSYGGARMEEAEIRGTIVKRDDPISRPKLKCGMQIAHEARSRNVPSRTAAQAACSPCHRPDQPQILSLSLGCHLLYLYMRIAWEPIVNKGSVVIMRRVRTRHFLLCLPVGGA